MKYNYEFDMKYTDNPYIDIIVNCVKILGMNAVVKNENEALHYEDVRSAESAADYMKYMEGYWDERVCKYDPNLYMEWNSYYRMLNGLPPAYTVDDEYAYLSAIGKTDSDPDIYEDIGIAFVIPELYKRYFIDMTQYIDSIPLGMNDKLNLDGRYLHELSIEELGMLESCGIMKQLLQDYSEDTHYQYIYHLGDKRIDYYTARSADNFSLLWIPELDTFDIIEQKFKRVFDRNRAYTIATVYSEAYRFMSYHYDAFIEILIIIQTMVDMISEVQEYIINKDVFDSRTIRYLFESYGIAYYKEIPVKYQIRIIKNVNLLLKYKSSHRNITDILELFDNNDVSIYTYYLLKTKKLNRDDFFYYSSEDVNPKYATNRKYWVGNTSNISNNKVPLTNVVYNKDESEFIKRYVYDYTVPIGRTDIPINRILSKDQVITSNISKELDSLTNELLPNSFLDTYMRNEIVNWFGIQEYNVNDITHNISYLENRTVFLENYRSKLTEALKDYMTTQCTTVQRFVEFALNRYFYKRVKYSLYAFFGIFNDAILKTTEFDSMSETELEQYFYQVDSLVDDDYRINHGIPSGMYDSTSEDRFVLHHSIPFMTYFDYRPSEIYDKYKDCYIFQNTNTFSITSDLYPDLYDKWTRLFRRSYLIGIRSLIEGIFNSLNINENNPYPRYIGWVDINYVISQLGIAMSEVKLGDEITTEGHDLIPIYNTPYLSEVVTEDMIGQEYYRKNYNLSFLKVPVLEPNAYSYLERYDMRRNYDTITLADPFWDGVSNYDILTEEERSKLHESKKNDVLSKDFTIERTKYIGVEAAIDLTKMSNQICYFLNMLFDKHKDEENIYIDINTSIVSTGRVRLNDILTFATALNYMYQGIEPDTVSTDMEKNMTINGFNFDTDWTDIYNYLQNQHHIYNNYNNTPTASYTYTDEFGVEHSVEDGYGMRPMMQGWKSELYEDFLVYDIAKDIKLYQGIPSNETDPDTGLPINQRDSYDVRVGAFLSGRYEQCPSNCDTTEEFNMDFGHSDIWNYNLRHYPKYNWNTNEFDTIDISWYPTQYPNDDNNSHGMWMNTHILNTMTDDDITDLDRINMLKKIYYSNMNLREHLMYMMRTAQSKRMYDIYKVLYDSFMETKLSNDFFRLADSNGSPIYIDQISGDAYNIVNLETYNKDSYQFPLYDLIDLITGDRYTYYFVHNEDYTDCKYVCDATGDVVDCIKNSKNVYIITEPSDEYPNGYMYPVNKYERQDKIFVLSYNTLIVLQNISDPSIVIPITIDSEGNISTIIEGDTDIPGGSISVSWNQTTGEVDAIITYDGEEPINIHIKPDIKVAEDYYEYMKYRNLELYNHMIDIKYNYDNVFDNVTQTYRPSDEKRQKIETLCEEIAIALENYFDKEEWKFLFNTIPTTNIKNIQNYIMKMVVFFKSWKTQIVDTSISYLIDDPYGNHVHILDDMYYSTSFGNLLEKVSPRDYIETINHTQYNDPINIRDNVEFKTITFEPWWVTFGFGEKIYGHNFDYPEFKTVTSYNDTVNIRDTVTIEPVEYTGDVTEDANGNLLFP
jgi:hypothetical protein